MKITGTRYVPAQPWFGQVDNSQPKQFNPAPLEAVVNQWFNKGAK